ncbi:uncharacterized protein MKZ38_006632 [Zalerion maritima]|uniref:Xylanolytic transcriptional activator regulatory domain-containing protein n=1 Tax=Zalerion maritima TaxID=339359 RepID=A0AAD5WNN1_9PEZI|nr:uncharacterized protein MKZ38_006632 [Zalerion maritima]
MAMKQGISPDASHPECAASINGTLRGAQLAGETICILCQFHKQACTFVNKPPKKVRRTSASQKEARNDIPGIVTQIPASPAAAQDDGRPSLLEQTLGLHKKGHGTLVGPTSLYEPRLLPTTGNLKQNPAVGLSTLRHVSTHEAFLLTPDSGTRNHDREVEDLDAIEAAVSPHGKALIHLYFRIVHPSFPILHKHVFLEKYDRTHREFSPPLLAAVYLLALNWWSYSAELSLLPKPNAARLEEIANKSMADIVTRPKLSTIQAGLLLLQRPDGDSWALTSKLVGVGQDIGLHMDCTRWRIPPWERGLRKRLGWALYMQDKWGSLVHGRPSHITSDDWGVPVLDEGDFPERAADENDEEGSTEVEKGRVLFCEMIDLTRILADVLSTLYTQRAEQKMRAGIEQGAGWVLDQAKPLQLRLKRWFADLPACLSLQDVTMRKLSSTGYLHLAYFATEFTLHRRILEALGMEGNSEIIHVCRVAARDRLVKTLDFVKSLRPEHLQSFWYSASKYNFAIVGTFICLLASGTPPSFGNDDDNAEFYKTKLEDYKWTLRLSSKNADILDRALALMATSVGVLCTRAFDGQNPRERNPARTGTNDGFGADPSLETSTIRQPQQHGFSPFDAATFDLQDHDMGWFQGGTLFDPTAAVVDTLQIL